MDLVVRTPHGDADVTIVRHGPHTTLGDLIVAVTGQAVPRVARVDDRTVDCSTLIDDAELFVGSLVTTDPTVPEPRHPDDVLLEEIAGPGAGRARPLSPGRYRTGPGHRMRADELCSSVVEESAFELTVTVDGVTVELPPAGAGPDEGLGTVRLAGVPVHDSASWLDEILTVGNRAFVAERRPEVEARRLGPPNPDGTVPFNRPPGRPAAAPRRPAIDAIRDAATLRATLWQRRPQQPGAFVFPIGIRERSDDSPEIVELDLSTEPAVAVAGNDARRTALGRAILVEATTAHGPADLDVVIVTAVERVAVWEWAKWLPHLRPADRPMVLSTPDDITCWVDALDVGASADASHLTLLVIDDPELWRRRDSPLRRLLSSAPGDLRVVALCDELAHAPALCTTLIAELADQRWHVTKLADDVEVDGVCASLVDSGVATEVARALAPLVDTELPTSARRPGRATPDQTLLDLLGHPASHDLRRRWDDPAIDLTSVELGTRHGTPVGLDVTAGSVVVVAAEVEEAARTAIAIAVAACTRLDPSSMLLLDLLRTPWSGPLTRLPHATDRALTDDDIGRIEPDRLLARLRHVALQDRPESMIVVIGTTDHNASLVDALLIASHQIGCLRVIVATDDGERQRWEDLDVKTTLTVDRIEGRRHSVVETTDGSYEAFVDDDVIEGNMIVLRPFELGRALSPLEHRIHRRFRCVPDTFVAECDELAQRACAASGDIGHHWLVPPSLPPSVDTEALFREHPGDAVPIGLVDVPATGLSPLWWQPDGEALLAIGSPRSGVDDLLDTILVGIVDRFGTDDLDLVVVDRSASRRRTIASLSHCRLVVAPDQHDDLLALVGALEQPRTIDDVPLVVLVDDLGQLRRHTDAAGLLDRLDRALGAGASVAAVARHPDDAGSLIAGPGRRLGGHLDEPGNRIDFRLLSEPADEIPRGRCRLLESDDIAQLAAAERSITAMLSDRLTEHDDARR